MSYFLRLFDCQTKKDYIIIATLLFKLYCIQDSFKSWNFLFFSLSFFCFVFFLKKNLTIHFTLYLTVQTQQLRLRFVSCEIKGRNKEEEKKRGSLLSLLFFEFQNCFRNYNAKRHTLNKSCPRKEKSLHMFKTKDCKNITHAININENYIYYNELIN